MSLLGSGTLANIDVAYYSGGGGGGGGPTPTFSTVTVSSISGAGSVLNLEGTTEIVLDALQMTFPTGGTVLSFPTNDGVIDGVAALVGLSTINGAAYAPPKVAVSTIVSGGVTVGSLPINITAAPVTLSTGKCYLVSVNLDNVTNGVIGAPTEGDHAAVVAGAQYVGTIDLVQLSSIKGRGQPFNISMTAPIVADAGSGSLSAYCNTGATASTFIGSTVPAWYVPLN